MSPQSKIMFTLIANLVRFAPVKQLAQINNQLQAMGLPALESNMSNYRTTAAPRFVISWSGIRLTEVYLAFLVNSQENPVLYQNTLSAYPEHLVNPGQIEIPITIKL